jgi:hypothetical protein
MLRPVQQLLQADGSGAFGSRLRCEGSGSLCRLIPEVRAEQIRDIIIRESEGGQNMQFMIRALDGKGKLAKRMEVRPRHLEGMERLRSHIICAGGLLDEEGGMKGSVLILDFPSRADLDTYLASEPYVLEQVWETIEVEPMNVVIGGK